MFGFKKAKKDKTSSLKEKRKVIAKTTAGFLIFALLFGGGALSLAFASKNPNSIKTDDKTSYVKIGEIWNQNDLTFNKSNFQTLLNYITGTSNADIDEINTLASRTTKWTADDMRATRIDGKAAGKDIIVTMGGLDWEACYLSQTKDTKEPILTLWLANSSRLSTWSDGWFEDNPWAKYPSNMYGTSYIRAVTLNNGKTYSTSATSTKTATQSSSSIFAKFTMDNVPGSLTEFIVTPAHVEWQEYGQDTISQFGFLYSSPNENWSQNIPSNGTYQGIKYKFGSEGDASYNYAAKSANSVWKDDKIWLPSLVETGYGETGVGLWETSAAQRDNSTYTWLRTGHIRNANFACYLYPDSQEVDYNCDFVEFSASVRPALHLNLAAAELAVAAEDVPEPPSGAKNWIELAAEKFDNESTTKTHLSDSTLGTERKPYKIKTAEQLALLAKDVINGNSFSGKYFKQTADIRLDGFEWTSIGKDDVSTTKRPFSGTFDGNGFAIDGLTINNTDTSLYSIGLFGYVSGGTIKNVNVASGYVTSVNYKSSDQQPSLGLVASAASNTKIIGCINRAYFSGGSHYVGGIVGVGSSVTIQNCKNYGNLYSSSYAGFVGELSGDIIDCYNYGDVSGSSHAGGIAGSLTGTIKNCISDATVSSSNFMASLVAELHGTMQNCAAYGKLRKEKSSLPFNMRTSACLVAVASSDATIEGCSFKGSTSNKDDFSGYFCRLIAGVPAPTIKCCYVFANQEGFYSSETDDWSKYFAVLDVPRQKSLYWTASAVSQTNKEIIEEMKKLGFVEYVQE